MSTETNVTATNMFYLDKVGWNDNTFHAYPGQHILFLQMQVQDFHMFSFLSLLPYRMSENMQTMLTNLTMSHVQCSSSLVLTYLDTENPHALVVDYHTFCLNTGIRLLILWNWNVYMDSTETMQTIHHSLEC